MNHLCGEMPVVITAGSSGILLREAIELCKQDIPKVTDAIRGIIIDAEAYNRQPPETHFFTFVFKNRGRLSAHRSFFILAP